MLLLRPGRLGGGGGASAPPPATQDAAEVRLLFPGFSWCQKGWGQSVEGASWEEGLVSRDRLCPGCS